MRKLLLILGIAFINNIQAADLTIPNTFTAGTPAVAVDVNANFAAVETEVDDNNASIVGNASGITTNASNITSNNAGITGNAAGIVTNASGITTNTSGIATNVTGITGNAAGIVTNASGITTNTSGIATNASNITINASGISTSASEIATNTANITIHTSNIANIDSRVSMLEVTYLIGDIGPAGGWVFYVTGDGLHGLEAAPEDQVDPFPGAVWGCSGTDIAGAESTAIGTGARNTDDIIRGCPFAGIAAAVADEYISPSGYIDWYLPSPDELNAMYLNIGPGSTAPVPVNVGGFDTIFGAAYWSSSEFGINGALGQRFDTAVQDVTLKSIPIGVRAVRAF